MTTEHLEFKMKIEGARAVQKGLQDTVKSTKKLGDETRTTGNRSTEAAKKTGFFRRSVRGAGDDAKRSSRSIGGMTKAVGLLAGGYALFKGGQLVNTSIGAATDMGETVSKVGVVFGRQAKEMERWGDQAAGALGMSKRQALDAASSFALFGGMAGLGGKETAAFSRTLAGAAADMASFHQASPEETLQAIRSGLSGEAEPLKRFNILMNESSVGAAAMDMGLIKATKNVHLIKAANLAAQEAQKKYTTAVRKGGPNSAAAIKAGKLMADTQATLATATKGSLPQLTEQHKVLARQRLIMQGLGVAQGDFARTSEGAANKSKELAANQENLNAVMGEELLPTYTRVLRVSNKFVKGMLNGTGAGGDFADVMKVVGGVLRKGAAFVHKHQDAIKVLGAGLLAGVVAFKAYKAAAAVLTGVQIALNFAMTANPIGLVILGVVALGAAMFVAYKKVDWFRNGVNAAWAGIKKSVSGVIGFVREHWKGLLIGFGGPLGLAVVGIVSNFDKIKKGFFSIVDAIKFKWNRFAVGLNEGLAVANRIPGVNIGSLPTFGGGSSGGAGGAASIARGTNAASPGAPRGPLGGSPLPQTHARLRSGIAAAGGGGRGGDLVVPVHIDGKEVARAVVKQGRVAAART